MQQRMRQRLLAGLLMIGTASCQMPAGSERQVQQAIVDMFVAVDAREWEQVKSAFADAVLLDYQSMTGAKAEELSPGQIVTAWSGFLPGFDHTHHQLGNFQISTGDANTATGRFYGTATHTIAGAGVWTVVGTYEVGLTKAASGDRGPWRIRSLKFNFRYADGNLELPALAQSRAQQN